MCEFISWIEKNGRIYFLDDDKLSTKKGKKLLSNKVRADVTGHYAIKTYFSLGSWGSYSKGECTNFSTPNNFPKEIVETIKLGKFRKMGIAEDILTRKAREMFNKKVKRLDRKYSFEYIRLLRESRDNIEDARIRGWHHNISKMFNGRCNSIWSKINDLIEIEEDKVNGAFYKERNNLFWDIAVIKKNRKLVWR